MRLVAFGSCNVLNCSTESNLRDENSWVKYSADILGFGYSNLAEQAVDNNFIFDQVALNLRYLNPADDVIVIGWCDISSRLFLDVKTPDSIVVGAGPNNSEWTRSRGRSSKSWDGLFNYKQEFGNPYYDRYFNQYHNDTLALMETLQKAEALSSILSKHGFKYVFTSDKNLFHTLEYTNLFSDLNWFLPNEMGIVEYTKAGYAISPTNCHLTTEGHQHVAELFVEYYATI